MRGQKRLLEKDLLAKGMTRGIKVLGAPFDFFILNVGLFTLALLVSYVVTQSLWSLFIMLGGMVITHLFMLFATLKDDKALHIGFSNLSLCKTTPFSLPKSYTPLTRTFLNPALREFSSAQHLPWSHLYDEFTVMTKRGELFQVLTLDGLTFHTQDDFQIDDNKAIRNRILYQMASPEVGISFYTIKRKHEHYPEGSYPKGYAHEFNERYKNKLQNETRYQNLHYIVLFYKAPRLAKSPLKVKPTGGRGATYQAYIAKGIKTLNEQSARLLSHYKAFGCRRLGNAEGGFPHSELLSFLSYLVNFEHRDVRAPIQSLHSYLSTKSHHFAKRQGVILLRGADGRDKFAAMLSLKEYPEETHASLMDSLLSAKVELIAAQSFFFKHNQPAVRALEIQQRKMEKADDSVVLAEKLSLAIEDIKAGLAAYGEHHFSLCVIADDVKTLNQGIYDIESKLNQDAGLIASREEQGVELAFWALLPGNQRYRIRQSLISSLNLAGFANLHNYLKGSAFNNHWGNAITLFETISGTPLYFNLHVGQVGNSIFIGSMGSGKTLLLSAILAFTMKYGGWRFIFDKDRGMEVITRALGGKYNLITPGKPSGMSPLQLADTPENRAFNILLLRKILSLTSPLSANEEKRIEKAIEGIYTLDKEARLYRNLAPFLGFAKPDSLREKFDRWHSEGQYAWLFDNERDSVDFGNPITGQDIGQLLNPAFAEVCTPALMYLFHRLGACLDSSPTLVFIPEGWKALSDPMFQEQLKDWSKTPRKNNMAMVMDTQNPEDLASSPAGCSIVTEARSQIFFGNAQAKWEHYRLFNLTEYEFEIITTVLPALGGYYFLLKQGNQSVIARLNLKGLNEDIPVLSSNLSRALLLDEIRSRVGDNPDAWLPHYTRLSLVLETKYNNAFPEMKRHFESHWEQES